MSRLIREDILKAKLLSEWVRDIDVVDAFLEELPGYEEPDWTEIFEDDERTFPPVDEDGYSDYILISLENFTIPLIGRYQVDDKGGAFYLGDDEEPASRHDFMVNAWMPLPAPFLPKEDES